MRHIRLQSPTDLAGFRQACRALLAVEVAPQDVDWQIEGVGSESLFSDDEDAEALPADVAPTQPRTEFRVPKEFLTLCESVILHRDQDRFGLLYGLLWRLVREPDFRHDTLDPAMTRARLMAQAVRRDMHKMTAFVRFRELPAEETASDKGPVHVAWFEPDHHIVQAIAPFFIRRFHTMRWAILTPECSIRWDGHALQLGPGATRDDAPEPDANEALWLTYYQSIFNPARLKIGMMKKEMPMKYWQNLPEAALIAPLVASAQARSEAMVAEPATVPSRRPPTRRPSSAGAGEGGGALQAAAQEEHDGRPSSEHPGRRSDASQTLQALHEQAAHCRDCPIGEHATQVVWGEGRPQARLMVVGEQPGDQEDLQGRPFVGPSGQLFDRAVADLGWSRGALYVTNAVKHFKFEVRGRRRIHKTPSQREAAICHQWLDREIENVQPEAFLALGSTAARSLMGRAVAVMSERGQWLTREDGRQVLITLHPSALLRLHDSEREAAYEQWLGDLRLATRIAAIERDG